MAPASSDRRQAKLLRGPELQVRRQTGMTTTLIDLRNLSYRRRCFALVVVVAFFNVKAWSA